MHSADDVADVDTHEVGTVLEHATDATVGVRADTV
tara:strand:+ start:321 stop:425 length:105 start_codon:yes stop_codon:yes gene_type:complete